MCDDDDEDDFAVIKDSYPDERSRFEETALLDYIHEAAIFPGVVRVLAAGDVLDRDGTPVRTPRLTTVGPPKVDRRSKKRLVMGSRGSQLTAARSVRDILMAVYDGTEGTMSHLRFLSGPNTTFLTVHRALVNEKGYLHRDISLDNFLIYPQHANGSMGAKQLIKNSPKFIKDILVIPWWVVRYLRVFTLESD